MSSAAEAATLPAQSRALQMLRALVRDPFSGLALFLVVAFLIHLEMNEPRQQVEQAVTLERFFPEVRRTVRPACGVWWIARAAVVSLVERQEPRGVSLQPGAEADVLVIQGKVSQTVLELKEQFLRVAVALILHDGVGHRLLGQLVFQLERDDRQAVDEKDFVIQAREIQATGGLRLEEFIAELEPRARSQ